MMARLGFVCVLFTVAAGHLGEHRTSLRMSLAPIAPDDSSNLVTVDKNSSVGSMGLLGTRNRLYLCNSHHAGSLMAFAGKERAPITTQGIPLNTCREYVRPLYIGDVIRFEVGKASTMVFLPTEPIGDDGVVLFAVHQGPEPYKALLVKSQFFRRLVYPQVVAVNVADDASNADRIQLIHDSKAEENVLLTYDQVRPIDRGFYDVKMVTAKGTKDIMKMTAVMGETYVVLRTGAAEAVVFPDHSGAPSMSAGVLALLLVFLVRPM